MLAACHFIALIPKWPSVNLMELPLNSSPNTLPFVGIGNPFPDSFTHLTPHIFHPTLSPGDARKCACTKWMSFFS